MGVKELQELAKKKGINIVPIQGYKPNITAGRRGVGISLTGVQEDKPPIKPIKSAIEKAQESASLTGTQLSNALKQKQLSKDSNIFAKLGAGEKEIITDIQNLPLLISRMKKYAEIIPSDRPSAYLFNMQINTPIVKDLTLTPKQRNLKTGMEIITQTATRLYQKGTLSNTDRQVFNEALNAVAEGKENFNAALDTLNDMITDKANSLARTYSIGYDIPEEKLKYIMNIDKVQNKNTLKQSTSKPKQEKSLDWGF